MIKLLGQSSVSSGVRRIEAVTGTGALREFRRDFEVARLAGLPASIVTRARQIFEIVQLVSLIDLLHLAVATWRRTWLMSNGNRFPRQCGLRDRSWLTCPD